MAVPDPSQSPLTVGRSAMLVGFCYLVSALLGILLSHGVYDRSFFETARGKGDNLEYLQLTRAILENRLDDPALARSKRLYLTMPVLVAQVSRVTRLDPVYAQPLLCWIAAALSWFLACRLYGPATAALILCIDFSLMERFIYGGPEAPVLFLCLLGLWLGRNRGRASTYAASVSLALAVTVRPFAIFFLMALWGVLLARRALANLLESGAVSGAIFALYLLFIHQAHMASDPIGGYRFQWYGSSPFSIPLLPIALTISSGEQGRAALAKQLVYILMILTAVILLARNYRTIAMKLPLDCLAFALSALFMFTYNTRDTLSEFARYSVLCVPFACYLIWEFLTTRYRISLWTVFGVCLAVSVFSALSTNNVGESISYLGRLMHSRT